MTAETAGNGLREDQSENGRLILGASRSIPRTGTYWGGAFPGRAGGANPLEGPHVPGDGRTPRFGALTRSGR